MTPQGIRILYLVLFATHFLWEQLLLLLNRRYVRRAAQSPPSAALQIWGAEGYARSLQYSRVRGDLASVSLAVGAAFVLTMLLTGWLGRLETLTAALSVPAPLRGVAFLYAVSLLSFLIELPLQAYSQFVVEERFGFNRTSVGTFAADTLKSLALSLVLLTPLLYGLFALVPATALWFVYAFAAFAMFQLAITWLYPRLIAPLFNRFSPLPEGALRQGIRALVDKLGFRAGGVFVMDGSRRSAHSNAYFTGFGRARRIVLFDTLISKMGQEGEEQVAAVLAHEIGHARLGHVTLRLLFGIVGSLAGFWMFDRVLDYTPLFEAFGFARSSPQAALVLGVFFSGPVGSVLRPLLAWWSRRQELASDRFAARRAGCGPALAEALKRLARDNLSNPTPHPLYSLYHASHPPVLERLRALAALEGLADEQA